MSFLKKSFSTFATRSGLIFIKTFSSILIARILGPTLKGRIAMLLAASQMLFMLGNLGFGSAFSFYSARKKFELSKLISLSFWVSLIFGSVMIAIFFISFKLHASLWTGNPPLLIFSAVGLTFLLILHNDLTRIIQGCNKIYELNYANLINSFTYLISLILFIYLYRLQVAGVIISQYISILLTILFIILLLKKDFKWTSIEFNIIKKCFIYGIKIYFLLLLNFLNYRLDIFLVKYFTADDKSVGYYSLAVGIAEMMWIIPNSIVTALFPAIAESNKKETSILTLRSCRWSLLLLLIISTGIVIMGKYAIIFVYGIDYLPSYFPLLLLLPGVLFFPLGKFMIVDLAARGYPGYGTITSAIALLINVVLNIILIPRFGINGAAIATSISYTFITILSLYFFVSYTKNTLSDILIIPRKEFELTIKSMKLHLLKLGKALLNASGVN